MKSGIRGYNAEFVENGDAIDIIDVIGDTNNQQSERAKGAKRQCSLLSLLMGRRG